MQAQADAGDATALHMKRLEDHFMATAAEYPDAAVETLVLMAVAYTCWEAGFRKTTPAVSEDARRRLAVQPGALLRACGQVMVQMS